MFLSLKPLVSVALGLGLTFFGAQARAEWPDKPIKMIVPYAAGSGVDVVMRPIANAMAKELGQQVVIDNKPSAGGIVGTQAIATAAPDGYTFGYGNLVTLAINRAFFSKLPYDPEKDLQPIGAAVTNAYVLVARNDLPFNTFKELIDYAKKNPGKLSFGTPGVGSAAHLAGETINTQNGISMVHVPYKTGAQGVSDMVGGQLDLTIDNLTGILPFIQQKRVKAIVVTSLQRVPVLPDVPTLHDSGMPGFDFVAWGGMVAPAGTPKPLIDKLNLAMRAALKDPAFVKLCQDFSTDITPSTPDEFRELTRREVQRWAAAVKAAGVKGD